jgi:nicotinamidase-related amidase
MRRGLQPRDGRQGRVAILALDLLTDFDFPDGPAVRRALSARAAALRRLLQRARRARIPVIYTNDNLGGWRSDSAALMAHCTQPELPGAALVESLLPGPDDSIVLKPRHSAFYGTPLEPLLDDHGVDTLILTGISAESCVWMTACDAHTRGFGLVIPADTLAGSSNKSVRLAITSLREVLGARVPRTAASLRFARGKVRS